MAAAPGRRSGKSRVSRPNYSRRKKGESGGGRAGLHQAGESAPSRPVEPMAAQWPRNLAASWRWIREGAHGDPEEGRERPEDGSKARPAPLMAQAVWSGSELRGKGLWRAGAGLWPGRGPEPHQGTFLSEEQGLSDKRVP